MRIHIWFACDVITLLKIVLPKWRQLKSSRSWVGLVCALAVGLINSLLGQVQKLLFAIPIRRTEPVGAPVFIVGHWRSGTTILHELLASDIQFTYPNNYVCFCPHHFLLTEWLCRDGFDSVAPATRLVDDIALDACAPQEDEFALMALGAVSPYRALAFPNFGLEMAAELERSQLQQRSIDGWKKQLHWFVRALTFREKKRLVLKSPLHALRIKILRELYPQAKFIVIERHREATIASTVAMWTKLCQHESFCQLEVANLRDQVTRTYDAFQHSLEEAEGFFAPQQIYRLAFEDLLADPVSALRNLYQALELGEFCWATPRTLQLLISIKAHRPAFD